MYVRSYRIYLFSTKQNRTKEKWEQWDFHYSFSWYEKTSYMSCPPVQSHNKILSFLRLSKFNYSLLFINFHLSKKKRNNSLLQLIQQIKDATKLYTEIIICISSSIFTAVVELLKKKRKNETLKMFVMTADNGCVCCRNPTFLLF